jgi:hypothetical protein
MFLMLLIETFTPLKTIDECWEAKISKHQMTKKYEIYGLF